MNTGEPKNRISRVRKLLDAAKRNGSKILQGWQTSSKSITNMEQVA